MPYLPAKMVQVLHLLYFPTNLPDIHVLDYLLSLKSSGWSINFLKIHLAAISMFHLPVDTYSVFSYPVSTNFQKGLIKIFPKWQNPYQSGTWTLFYQHLWSHCSSPCILLPSASLCEGSIFVHCPISHRNWGAIDNSWLTHPLQFFTRIRCPIDYIWFVPMVVVDFLHQSRYPSVCVLPWTSF